MPSFKIKSVVCILKKTGRNRRNGRWFQHKPGKQLYFSVAFLDYIHTSTLTGQLFYYFFKTNKNPRQ